jgi:hypothetical protein
MKRRLEWLNLSWFTLELAVVKPLFALEWFHSKLGRRLEGQEDSLGQSNLCSIGEFGPRKLAGEAGFHLDHMFCRKLCSQCPICQLFGKSKIQLEGVLA